MLGCGHRTVRPMHNPTEKVVLDVTTFVDRTIPIVDVRAPVEFERGHIPGAINIQLLTNDDRHHVGLCYRENGHHAAVQLGLERVGPRMAALAQSGLDLAQHGQLMVYCQRGGKRSQSMSWLWSQVGLEMHRLDGGYKSFRTWVQSTLQQPTEWLVLAGGTGVGKTDILHALAEDGEPMIDLEGLAHHKGSAFGAIGERPAPSQSQFENQLALNMHKEIGRSPIWLESESRRVGTCQIPDPVWEAMQSSPRIYIDRDRQQRVTQLCHDYKDASIPELERALNGIRKRLGPEGYQNAMKDLHADNRTGVVEEVLGYYDRLYTKHKVKHTLRIVATIDVSNRTMPSVVSELQSLKDEKYRQIE